MTNSGGTSGGSPASSQSTSGTGTASRLQRPQDARLAQHVAIEDRRHPGGRDLDHDPARVAAGDGARVGQARRSSAQRPEAVHLDRCQALTQLPEIDLDVHHFSSLAIRPGEEAR